ncbi:hypothetical protein FACS1894109_02910 [Spirochaetia bacterium]|nr:hypothetical protein FACS1894109_02910 [Spirochaetia bacterium]
MKKNAWTAFVVARDHYRKMIEDLCRELPRLGSLQQRLVNSREGPVYAVETPIVYNGALDDVQPADNIKLILVADNPGRREQAAENRRYLVGPSGKIAEKFFRETPVLNIDFRRNVIILNKTPIHTPRTAELAELRRLGGAALITALEESQRAMAALLLEFHCALSPVPVWITGYSEMKKGGIFEAYTNTVRNLYVGEKKLKKTVLLFRHFSMNQFTIDLHKQTLPEEAVPETLERIGAAYRERVLGK